MKKLGDFFQQGVLFTPLACGHPLKRGKTPPPFGHPLSEGEACRTMGTPPAYGHPLSRGGSLPDDGNSPTELPLTPSRRGNGHPLSEGDFFNGRSWSRRSSGCRGHTWGDL